MFDTFNPQVLFGLLGGLGLFVLGMRQLSEGLQLFAGERLRKPLSLLTGNRFVGSLLGMSLSMLLQSSSAASIMVVGFVNAGLLSLLQGIGVVLGVNLGTVFTTQLIAFDMQHLALPAIALGVALKVLPRRPHWLAIGDFVIGFGLLFLGLAAMRGAFDALKESVELVALLENIGSHRLLGVLCGAALTILAQSGSATIGLTVALASTGLLSLDSGVALILGENIGSTITTNLAAYGAAPVARRTALAHLFFNVSGVVLVLLVFKPFLALVQSLTPGSADFVIKTQEQARYFSAQIGDKPFIARHIANSHTLFNVLNLLIFLPFTGAFGRLTCLLISGHNSVSAETPLQFIDTRVLNTPPIALGQARAEIRLMARHVQQMLDGTLLYLHDGDPQRLPLLIRQEERLDLLQREITDFLAALAQKPITAETSQSLVTLMQIVSDLERIGDCCQNLWRLGQRRNEQKISFSAQAIQELENISAQSCTFLAVIVAALESDDHSVKDSAREQQSEIARQEEVSRGNHMGRLSRGECAVQPGLLFIDLLHNFEQIGAHIYGIASRLDEGW